MNETLGTVYGGSSVALADRNRVLRNTYWLLALSLVPTVLGAWVGVASGFSFFAGNPLIGIPAKIADGFFLVALNDSKAETDANLTLLRRQSWIDIPVVYKSGRRALFTMEKGIPGDKVFDEALKAWSAAEAGSAATTPG